MSVYVRSSNEVLLRARAQGAMNQRGCRSHPRLIIGPGHGPGAGIETGVVGGRKFCCLNGVAICKGFEMACENTTHQGLFHKKPWWH